MDDLLESSDQPGEPKLSLAFTPSGRPAIAYTWEPNAGESLLKYAEYNGTGWNVQEKERATIFDSDPCLAFTPAGGPAISYAGGARIYYSVFRNGWATYEVPTSTLNDPKAWTSLAFNPVNGNPVISYYNRTQQSIWVAFGTVTNIVLG